MSRHATLLLALVTLAASGWGQRDVAALAALSSGRVGASERSVEAQDGALSKVIGFEVSGAFIIVEASVDGRSGRYILDSGAPGLILNDRVLEAIDSAVALGSVVPIGQRRVGSFAWGPLRQTAIDAYVLDLSYLEGDHGSDIAGIIGYDQLAVHPVAIDYPRRTISFLPSHRAARREGTRISFRLRGHLPVLSAVVDRQRIGLAFDTGAGINLIDHGYFPDFEDVSAELPAVGVRGLGAVTQLVPRRSVALTQTDQTNWLHLPYGFADLSSFDESLSDGSTAGRGIDGVLGQEWMRNRVITIDYSRGRLYVR